ncbi:MAG: DNA-binding protein [Pseudomonadota bacterium]
MNTTPYPSTSPTTVSQHGNSIVHGAFPAIDTEARSHVETATAAYWLNRKPQTLRAWASQENGPLRPTRVHGRLAWSVSEIRTIMNGGAA